MEFTNINNTVNGTPRIVIHFLSVPLSKEDEIKIEAIAKENNDIFGVNTKYAYCFDKVKKAFKNKNVRIQYYHNKSFGGGIVFSTWMDKKEIEEIINKL